MMMVPLGLMLFLRFLFLPLFFFLLFLFSLLFVFLFLLLLAPLILFFLLSTFLFVTLLLLDCFHGPGTKDKIIILSNFFRIINHGYLAKPQQPFVIIAIAVIVVVLVAFETHPDLRGSHVL